MDELENRYLLGEWTPLSDTPPPNIKDKNPQEQETPKKKRDGKKKRELMKEPTGLIHTNGSTCMSLTLLTHMYYITQEIKCCTMWLLSKHCLVNMSL